MDHLIRQAALCCVVKVAKVQVCALHEYSINRMTPPES